MKLLVVSVGTPREVQDERRGTVRTGIWKTPVSGPMHLTRLNLAGDGQADLVNHGGLDKAVYGYPCEHYPLWRRELERPELAPGGFGENLTTEGLLEHAVCIGDRFRIGSAVLEVSQPRSPCFKLGIRFGDPRMVRRFQESGRSGFYLRVIEEGVLAAGDAIVRIATGAGGLTVAEVNRLWFAAPADRAGAARAAALPTLAASWREAFAERLAGPAAAPGHEAAS
jgi:MOSC domain-containing protein YiiM